MVPVSVPRATCVCVVVRQVGADGKLLEFFAITLPVLGDACLRTESEPTEYKSFDLLLAGLLE